ncbi:hypothetical protein QJS10_CPA09g01091 [Acorus calamus]|uniref:Pentatricopeptide repeat-containing protein n=1 Tax=Acorus calamus TaxID=4465 RepID=A0AAV9E7L2_ACOCL|nr:hypothetical protein QJS10_CPA09g01091 [Acorus calamus]
MRMSDEMLQRKVMYITLIGFLCNSEDLEKAMEVKQVMGTRRPIAVTYALLMEGLCVRGGCMAMEKMVFDMEYWGCKPEAVNYRVLMSDSGRPG